MTIAVVGGGPAGLFAAERLATSGQAVTVFEHRASVGRKFLLAGRGGLNLTHTEPIDALLNRYGARRRDLEVAVRDFDADALRVWADGLGEETFEGSSGRVFPKSFRATPLLRAWLRRLDELGVSFRLGHRWSGWGDRPGALRFEGPDGSTTEVDVEAAVFALGGASWPRVGSDGGWVRHFTDAGIGVTPLAPANCGLQVAWTQGFAERFAGTPLKNVSVRLCSEHTRGQHTRGDVMITTHGIEGGPVYAHAADVRQAIERGDRPELCVDLQPDLTVERLADRLDQRRRSKDALSTALRRCGFGPLAIGLLRESSLPDGRLPTDHRALAETVKCARLVIGGLMTIDRAISSAGGVRFGAIDNRYMLRQRPGSFVAGEMIDWEAPTGGYLLQASFSTAHAAADGALDWARRAER